MSINPKLNFLQIIICSLFLSTSLSSQTYIDIPWREGHIVKAGEQLDGMIRLGGELFAPYLNNSKVYFVPADEWIEGKRPKKKVVQELEPEDIDGYQTTTEDDNGEVVDMKFTTWEILVKGTFKKKPKKVFLKLEEEGAVTAYHYVPIPEKSLSLLTTPEDRRRAKAQALRSAELHIKKGDGDLMLASEADLVSLMGDCNAVTTAIKNEGYGFKPKSQRPKKKGLGKIVANTIGDNSLEDKILMAIRDYNDCVE